MNPSANLPDNSAIIGMIFGISVTMPLNREFIISLAAAEISGKLFTIPPTNDEIKLKPVSINIGAYSATFDTTCTNMSPKAETMPSIPLSSKPC
ncbi:hypothetical protein SDC9_185545 [bioreactor metagenome]|uniref:Uncharacterized protein n=1 Tax=bioreactor metagenome TaxID=1076179 RepID=A0A645HI05_9ZZZZ